MTDPIADMLTRIRNAVHARHPRVDMPASRFKAEIARILEQEGYIQGFKLRRRAPSEAPADHPHLAEVRPARRERHLRPRARQPARPARVFGRDDVPKVMGGLGTSILTTSQRRDDRPRRRQGRRRRRSALQHLVEAVADGLTVCRRSRAMTDLKGSHVSNWKKPIPVPKGVTVTVRAGRRRVQGAEGHAEAARAARREVRGQGHRARRDDRARRIRSSSKFHGLARSLMANAVEGVTQGFKKELDIVGVGYRAEVKGKQVVFALGYSHPVVFDIPAGIDVVGRQADARHRDRHRPPARRPGRRQHPPAAQAGSVQAEGRAVHGRSAEEEGREDRGVEAGYGPRAHEDSNQERSPRADSAAPAQADSRARPSGRGWRCSGRWRTSTRR